MDKGTLSPSVFIHRHLQNLLDEFRTTNNLPISVSGEVMCAPYEVESRPLVRIVIDRNARVIGITNFFLAPEYQHQNIGKNFLKVAYALCKKYKYRLRLLHCVSTFYDRMQTRGATVITENEHLEITDSTDLESHH